MALGRGPQDWLWPKLNILGVGTGVVVEKTP